MAKTAMMMILVMFLLLFLNKVHRGPKNTAPHNRSSVITTASHIQGSKLLTHIFYRKEQQISNNFG